MCVWCNIVAGAGRACGQVDRSAQVLVSCSCTCTGTMTAMFLHLALCVQRKAAKPIVFTYGRQ